MSNEASTDASALWALSTPSLWESPDARSIPTLLAAIGQVLQQPSADLEAAHERVRVVEGEREHWKDHAEEAGRGFERVCLDCNRVAAARTAATARAESAEAAHRALRAAVEALADEWAEDYPGPTAACNRTPDEWARDLRALLAGGEER